MEKRSRNTLIIIIIIIIITYKTSLKSSPLKSIIKNIKCYFLQLYSRMTAQVLAFP